MNPYVYGSVCMYSINVLISIQSNRSYLGIFDFSIIYYFFAEIIITMNFFLKNDVHISSILSVFINAVIHPENFSPLLPCSLEKFQFILI